jgi:hypothetical protein
VGVSSADPNAFVALGMQSALGTPQTTAAKLRFAKYLSGSGFQAQLEVVSLREGGDGMTKGFTYKKMQKVAGQLVVNARPEMLGQILQFVPGGAALVGATVLPAVHTFDTGHASFPYGTLVAQHPGSHIPHLMSDVRFGGISIEGAGGEPIKVTVPFTAITHGASHAGFTPTYIDEQPFLYHSSPTYVVDGAGDTSVLAFKFDLGYSLEELQSQAVNLDDIVVQNLDATLEYSRRFAAATLWQKIAMGGGVSPTTSVATGDFRAGQLFGTGTTLRSFDLYVPLLAYKSHDIGELDPDGKTVTEVVQADALKGATHLMVALLKNSHASGYTS